MVGRKTMAEVVIFQSVLGSPKEPIFSSFYITCRLLTLLSGLIEDVTIERSDKVLFQIFHWGYAVEFGASLKIEEKCRTYPPHTQPIVYTKCFSLRTVTGLKRFSFYQIESRRYFGSQSINTLNSLRKFIIVSACR